MDAELLLFREISDSDKMDYVHIHFFDRTTAKRRKGDYFADDRNDGGEPVELSVKFLEMQVNG